MTRKIRLLVLPILMSLIILGGCGKTANNSELEMLLLEKDKNIEKLLGDGEKLTAEKVALEDKIEELEQEILQAPPAPTPTPTPTPQLVGPSPNVLSTSLEVIELLKDKDMTNLSQYVHAVNGLRFTPYFYIDMQNDQVFTAQEVATLDQNTTIFNWGDHDGSGDPINVDYNAYYNEFIYDEDFMNPHLIGNNFPIGTGNMIDNIAQAYPNGHFVEFHFTQIDPQYAGIDWRSLRLVFEQDNGLWYLVGIVHGQWTI